ncbi:MAG: hypothetical protein ABW252_17435 [Polyangiales bacterium]
MFSPPRSRAPRSATLFAIITASLLSGCVRDAALEDDGDDITPSQVGRLDAGLDAASPVDASADASGSRVLDDVEMFGACTFADTRVEASADGLEYRVELAAFSASREAQCTIILPLFAGARTYALLSSTIQGAATLPASTRATVITTPVILGLDRVPIETVLAGPRDGAFELVHAPAERVFLPCPPATAREQMVQTRVVIDDADAGSSGARVDVQRLQLRLVARDCAP